VKALKLLGALALALVLLATIAWAAPGPIIDPIGRWVKGGLYVGSSSVAGDAKNRITNVITADVDHDFAASTIVCTDSTPATTATGVKKGDPCFVGIGPRDGGIAIVTANSVFQAIATADDAVVVRHCAVGTAANPADAGYVVRCISSQ
jgi:hypothetical protein